MKKFYISLLLSAVTVVVSAQSFDANSIVVSRVTAGDNGQPLELVSYNMLTGAAGVAVSNTSLKGAATGLVVARGNLDQGFIYRSADGRYITVGGSNAVAGTVISSNSAQIIAKVPSNPVNLTNLTYTSSTTGANKGVVTIDGSEYWTVAGSGAVTHLSGDGATQIGIASPPSWGNFRTLNMFNSTPADNTKARMVVIQSFSPLLMAPSGSAPSNAAITTTLIGTVATTPEISSGGAGGNLQGVAFLDLDPSKGFEGTGYDVMYATVTVTNGDRLAGIYKYVLENTNMVDGNVNGTSAVWTRVGSPYTLPSGGAPGPIIATKDSNGRPVIYMVATNGWDYGTNNRLFVIADDSENPATDALVATAKQLAMAGTGLTFKGLAFAPTAAVSSAPIVDAATLTATLPVGFTSFKGSVSGNAISLSWTTATESNSENYIVERSFDNAQFASVGTVASKNAAGGASYQFNDISTFSGNAYYRIKAVDFDGTASYSTVISVKTSLSSSKVKVYPNPASDHVTVAHDEGKPGAVIVITSMNGSVVLSSKISKGSTQTSLNVSGLAAGTYVVTVNNGSKSVASLIKQ